ncbi:MAG TPA: YCF48-related protein [Thermoanaerobaculaceae bacterium]|nr:YCF48-related protein [Thermoanaerobaculaceae bacterium]
MRDARSHAVAPSFSFLDPLHGWVSWFAFSEAEGDYVERLVETVDGGRTWHLVLPSSFATLQFLDSRRGVAVARTETADTLMRTDDGGRSWVPLPLARPKHFDQVLFLDAQLGWVAGRDAHQAVVMRTRDGGREWSESRLSDTTLAEFRDLHFTDATNGWAVTWHYDDGGTLLFRTSDGGVNWSQVRDRSSQGSRHWLSVVRDTGRGATFGFYEEQTRRGKPGDAGGETWVPYLLFSVDRGEHWTRYDLSDPVFDCQLSGGDLICCSTAFRVLVVHPILER